MTFAVASLLCLFFYCSLYPLRLVHVIQVDKGGKICLGASDGFEKITEPLTFRVSRIHEPCNQLPVLVILIHTFMHVSTPTDIYLRYPERLLLFDMRATQHL